MHPAPSCLARASSFFSISDCTSSTLTWNLFQQRFKHHELRQDLASMSPSLMTLPAEVRQMIWKHIVEGAIIQPWIPQSFRCTGCEKLQFSSSFEPWAFMLTSKNIYNDSIHLFHQCRSIKLQWQSFLVNPTRPRLLDQIHTVYFEEHCARCPVWQWPDTGGLRSDGAALGKRILEFRNIRTIHVPKDDIGWYSFNNILSQNDSSQKLRVKHDWYPIMQSIMETRPEVHCKYDLQVWAYEVGGTEYSNPVVRMFDLLFSPMLTVCRAVQSI